MPIRSVYDKQKFTRLAEQQHGVVSRQQALECGLLRTRIDYLIREGGQWQRVLPGVYSAMTGAVTTEQQEMAALLHAGPQSMLTGAAAVGRHHVRCASSDQIDVLVPTDVRVASSGFVRVIHTGRMPEKCWSSGGIRFAPLPRAVADAARGMSRLRDVRALVADAVQQAGCDPGLLIDELKQGPSAGSARFRQALGDVCVGIRSAAEGDLKDIIDRSNLEKPLYNPWLFYWDGSFIGMPDAWWQRAGVAAEVDSLQYHMRADDYEETTLRHNRLQAHDINLLHFLPRTLRRDRRTVLADLCRAIEQGKRSPELPIVAIPTTG